jgi:predicted nuclease with TOPRIM domain
MNSIEIKNQIEEISFKIEENEEIIKNLHIENEVLEQDIIKLEEKLIPIEEKYQHLIGKYYQTEDYLLKIGEVKPHHQLQKTTMLSGIKIDVFDDSIGYFEISQSIFSEYECCIEIEQSKFDTTYASILKKIFQHT